MSDATLILHRAAPGMWQEHADPQAQGIHALLPQALPDVLGWSGKA